LEKLKWTGFHKDTAYPGAMVPTGINLVAMFPTGIYVQRCHGFHRDIPSGHDPTEIYQVAMFPTELYQVTMVPQRYTKWPCSHKDLLSVHDDSHREVSSSHGPTRIYQVAMVPQRYNKWP
jgi:hypothetical protein